MNVIYACHKIEDMPRFDKLFGHLSAALKNARGRIEANLNSSESHLTETEEELRAAWKNFHITLETVRMNGYRSALKCGESSAHLLL